MAKDRVGLFNQIILTASQRLGEHIKTITDLNIVPIGHEYMTPEQVKKRYGLGVQQIQDLMKEHGEDVVRREVLPLLEGR